MSRTQSELSRVQDSEAIGRCFSTVLLSVCCAALQVDRS
jgi:hypothetical protein